MEPDPRLRRTDFGNLSRADKLIVAQGALKALAEHPEIAPAMAPRGYGADGLAQGQALVDAARATTKTQGDTRTGRLGQTATQDRAVEDAADLYRPLAATAEVVYADRREVLVALGLTGEHSTARAARLQRMRSFAEQAGAPDLIKDFTGIGISDKAFTDLLAALDAATDETEDQDTDTAVSEDASALRREAFDGLDAWMVTMHGHARIVLADRPQLLEALGIRRR